MSQEKGKGLKAIETFIRREKVTELKKEGRRDIYDVWARLHHVPRSTSGTTLVP